MGVDFTKPCERIFRHLILSTVIRVQRGTTNVNFYFIVRFVSAIILYLTETELKPRQGLAFCASFHFHGKRGLGNFNRNYDESRSGSNPNRYFD